MTTGVQQSSEEDSPRASTNLLMTAIATGKQTISKCRSDLASKIEIDEGDASDGDAKQRKKELIIQRQLERRQQQELIRQQREEERARKAEEIRQRDEEAATKKQLEKSRKETIYAAYIDKKRQLQDEGQSAYHFGGSKIAQSNLANAKKYHSTYRLKPSTSNYNNSQQAFDDQASVISDRSSSVRFNNGGSAGGQPTNGTMMKSKLTFVCVLVSISFLTRVCFSKNDTFNSFVRKKLNLVRLCSIIYVKYLEKKKRLPVILNDIQLKFDQLDLKKRILVISICSFYSKSHETQRLA